MQQEYRVCFDATWEPWEPSWYFGGAYKRKRFVAGAGNGARSADFVARGGLGGVSHFALAKKNYSQSGGLSH